METTGEKSLLMCHETHVFPDGNNDILQKEQFDKKIAPQNGLENEGMKTKFPGGRSSLLQHLIGDVGDDFSSIQGASVSRLSSQNERILGTKQTSI